MGSKSLLGSLFQRDYVRKGDLYYQKGMLSKAADMYLKARRHQQAARIYIELGDIDQAVEIYRRAGEILAAGELLASQGRFKESITCFEEAGAYRKAAETALEAQQTVRAGRLFEKAAMYRLAAECFSRAGEHEYALGAWELEIVQLKAQQGDLPTAAGEQKLRQLDFHRVELLIKLGRPQEAGQLLMQHGQTRRAAQLFERSGRHADAVRAYLDADHAGEALAVLEKSPKKDEALEAEVLEHLHRFVDAAELYEKMKLWAKAATAHEKVEDWPKAATLWERGEAPERAAKLFLEDGLFADAGRCFAKANRHEDAAKAYLQASQPENAGDAYQASGDYLQAAQCYQEAGLTTAARDSFTDVGPDSPDFPAACQELLPLLLAESLLEEAEARLLRLDDRPADTDGWTLADRLYWQGRIEEQRGATTAAMGIYEKVLAEDPNFGDTADRLRQLRPPAGEKKRSADRSVTTDTQPIVVPESSLLAVELPDTAAAVDHLESPAQPLPASPRPQISERPEANQGLPFELGERVESWWDGAEIFHATDLRRQQEALLVSFALAGLGREASDFRRTMRQVRNLDHPVVLKLDEVILASDKVLLLYEPFSGQTLSRRLAKGHLPVMTAIYVLTQLCEGLSAAHQLGMTHQWLSPQTILLDDTGRLKIAGIGMREILAHRDNTSLAYLSPELQAGEAIGPASDVYSLGLLTLELLRAQLPVGWSESGSLDPAAVGWTEEVQETIPKRLREQFLRCLAPSPLDRPSTVELKTALAAFGLLPGQILVDRYEISSELGRGGMSRVYRARDRELDEDVAIKTVLTPAIGPSEDAERLLQEVRICRKITHPNVVRVHDFGRFPGGIFIIMELLEGPGLDKVIEHDSPLPFPRTRQILRDIASALSEAHRLDIIHRDLKPANVLFTGDRLKVMDFGIARMGSTHQQLTQTGQVIGSPRYMAPEQIQGLPLNGTCDLYALGVIAYTLLAGREPFLGDSSTAIVLKHLHEPPPNIRELRPEIPGAWCTMLDQLLAKKPADRLQNATLLLQMIDQLPDE